VLELIIMAILPCINFNTMDFHIHVHVSGIDIPANVGISPGCFREIHTHDTSGWLHLESSEVKQFTLRQFFEIWGKEPSGLVTINREVVNYDTPLRNGDHVVIR
jgi:hypothetical protein